MSQFHSGVELLELCKEQNIAISEAMLLREMQSSEMSREELLQEMRRNIDVMRASVEKGMKGDIRSISGLSGGDAARLFAYAEKQGYLGKETLRAVASAMAVVEVNAAMGRIVAAPTAGASGILPGVLFGLQPVRGFSDESMLLALFAAGAVGCIIAEHATLAGADGGCQTETGVAAAMAAAALTELAGGKPDQALHAAAIALKNVMGLVCDPVAGLVECPCIKRNALGAANAMLAADMALAGIGSIIPFDEVVAAMRAVGAAMRPELKETAMGGLAATPTGRDIAKRLIKA